jgi:cytochrome c oxidase subunit 1
MRTLRNLYLHMGLIRGLMMAAVWAGVAMAATMFIRSLLDMPTWTETGAADRATAIVTGMGAIFGTMGFLFGVGSLNDWIAWSFGRKGSDGHYHPKEGVPTWYRYFSFDTNHKVVGIQYGVTSLLVLLTGGLFALIFRTELAQPGLQYLERDTYNTYIGMHGLLMIVGILLGVGALSNYLVPIRIGAQDMAFPRLNGFSYWIAFPAAVLLLMAIPAGGFDTGWTAYPPLSIRAPLGMQFVMLSIFILGFSSILGSINLLVTIFMMRAPGMTWFRMPIFVWGVLAASLLQFTATQFFGLAFISTLIERWADIPFYDPARGGNVTLYQHLFWFYSHPTVYIWVLPGLGVISEILPVFSRKPLFGYKAIALSSMAIAFMGYLVWAHHMFTSAMDPFLRIPFMLTTFTIAVPTGIKFFNWLGTLWGGKIHMSTPMLFSLGAFVLFLIGGLTGPPSGLVVTGVHLHDTHWVVAHFHIIVFGGFFFTFLAAIYYWFPKMTGKMYNETMGRIHFWVMFPSFIVFALSLFRIGILGMPRRYADYSAEWGYGGLNTLATIAAFFVGASALVFVFNLVFSFRFGPKAAVNPWRSRGLEWQIASPVPEYNFSAIPEIVGSPYDYGLPGSVYAVLSPEDQVAPLEEYVTPLPPTEKPAPSGAVVPAPAGD